MLVHRLVKPSGDFRTVFCFIMASLAGGAAIRSHKLDDTWIAIVWYVVTYFEYESCGNLPLSERRIPWYLRSRTETIVKVTAFLILMMAFK